MRLVPAALLSLSLAAGAQTDWPHYFADPESTHYSALDQIHRGNVARLRPAWVYHTGDKRDRPQTTIECTPIVVKGVMYLTTAQLQAAAVDPATGRQLWVFDPVQEKSRGVNRGVTYWEEGADQRILYVVGPHLYCLNARTGKLIPGFGNEGTVDITKGLDRDITGLTYTTSSPGVIYKNLIILGATMGEGPRPSAPGHIRAWDVRTGKQAWMFHTIPHPGEPGHETWEGDSWKTAGAANNWGGMSVDHQRGMVFLSTGSAAFDFYGGQRLGDNVFANSVVALDAATGKLRWHFQTVHHDVWDYDIPCPPNLVTLRRDGRTIDAVAQVTKTGWVFVFERDTGKPVFGIEERPVPASDVPGERLARTQPFPRKPPPIAPQRFEPTDLSPEARAWVQERLKTARAGSIYTPPSREGTVVLPGFHGGAVWGGAAFDPSTNWVYVPVNNVPNLLTIVPARAGAAFPFDIDGYKKFEDQEGYPAVRPPWGQLVAVDLNRGDILWRTTVGEYPELRARGLPPTGTDLIGGAIVTAAGLVFMGASRDEKFRAFDAKTGKILWETELEAGGYATPMTYSVGGRQYVVIAAGGGGKQRTKAGDAFVAFALP